MESDAQPSNKRMMDSNEQKDTRNDDEMIESCDNGCKWKNEKSEATIFCGKMCVWCVCVSVCVCLHTLNQIECIRKQYAICNIDIAY